MTEFRVPDSPVPLEGFRVWGVVDTAEGPRLVSPTPGFVALRTPTWPTYEPFVAACLAPRPCRDAPGPRHQCGIHAFASIENAHRWASDVGRSRPVVVGRVRGWGCVVDHAGGWRAEFAYPSGFESAHRGRLVRRAGPCLDALAGAYGLAASVLT